MIGTLDLSQYAPVLDIIKKDYVDRGLTYGWQSRPGNDDQGHWNRQILKEWKSIAYDHGAMPMIHRHPEVKFLWEKIQEAIGKRTLVRCYVNGYTYGTDGYIHTDDPNTIKQYGKHAVSETVLIYLNKRWNIDWGGETIICSDDLEEIETSVLPKFGKAFIFDSHRLHGARPLSRMCKELRSIIVFKTASDAINTPSVDFLLQATASVNHSGSSFFEHLYNTAKVAIQNKFNMDVVEGCLYHSIYDTEYFKAGLNIPRSKVQTLISDRAEHLAYLFCTTRDRVSSFVSNNINVSDDDRKDLLCIEFCNLIEQQRPGIPNVEQIISTTNQIAKVLVDDYGLELYNNSRYYYDFT